MRDLARHISDILCEVKKIIDMKPGVLEVSGRYLNAYNDWLKNRDKAENYDIKNQNNKQGPEIKKKNIVIPDVLKEKNEKKC